jgi:RNA polymerase sigma-70 factor (ECF subfamily)
MREVLVGGLPGIVTWHADGTPFSVVAFTVTGGRITGISVVTTPAKLASAAPPA